MINRQQHKLSCGAVAVHNALEWSGFDTSYEEVLGLFKELKLDPLKGQWPYHLSKVLKGQKVENYSILAPTLKDIDKVIDSGDSIIFNYSWYDEDSKRMGAHFVFIDAIKGQRVRAWNSSQTNKTPWITRKRLKKLLRFTATNKHWDIDPIWFHNMLVIKAPK